MRWMHFQIAISATWRLWRAALRRRNCMTWASALGGWLMECVRWRQKLRVGWGRLFDRGRGGGRGDVKFGKGVQCLGNSTYTFVVCAA